MRKKLHNLGLACMVLAVIGILVIFGTVGNHPVLAALIFAVILLAFSEGL